MNAEHSQYFVDTFPGLYRDYGGDMRDTCMAWGFECGDGWFDLLEALSKNLEPLGVVASQVKEKYGGLRLYTTGESLDVADRVDDLIDAAEDLSLITCEECGGPGECNTGGWLSTRCPDCREIEAGETRSSTKEDDS